MSQTAPIYWEDAKKHLIRRDKIMAGLIRACPNETLQTRGEAFYTLIRSIVGQQISVRAADSVWAKLENMLPRITPQTILGHGEENLRKAGLSGQKVGYMKNIADHFITQKINHDYWHNRPAAEIAKELCTIKGVGPWTAEMFLIFHVMHPDIFPIKDLGLINAIKKQYGALEIPEIRNLAKTWEPFRTVATWYLWRSIDPEPVNY